MSHRGTKGLADWGNNLAYTVGAYNLTDRYKKGKKIQEDAEKKYGKQNISTIGHSQGAVLSRKLGSKSKEIINVNPAYLGEKPQKNEYNIRSTGDVVSQLYKPIATARSILYPKYSAKHDISIDSQSFNPIVEHNAKILDRLDAQQEIGACKRKSKKILIRDKVNHLVEYGLPRQAITLLKKLGYLEIIYKSVSNGTNIRPLLEDILSKL